MSGKKKSDGGFDSARTAEMPKPALEELIAESQRSSVDDLARQAQAAQRSKAAAWPASPALFWLVVLMAMVLGAGLALFVVSQLGGGR